MTARVRCAAWWFAVALACAGCAARPMAVTRDAPVPQPARAGVTGTVVTLPVPASHGLAPRRVDVWLPPGYAAHPRRRYPVLYVHDGQNLFDPASAYGGTDWGIDEAMTRLVASGAVRPAIVVGIWNTPARMAEYMPQRAVPGASAASGVQGVARVPRAALRGDAYVDFLADTLKPAVDRALRTRPGRDDTFVMGSSMGGLVSLYALARHPRVFGGAAALSTHWPAADGAAVDWLAAHLPAPDAHRLYFDHGTATLDAGYAPYQQRMDAALLAAGWRQGPGWRSAVFPGAAHDEHAWRARVDQPLRFLLHP